MKLSKKDKSIKSTSEESEEESEESEESKYIKSLTKQELQTMEIARSHLESSFHLTKSVGFIKWKEMSLKKEN
jgi:hypothetical protein